MSSLMSGLRKKVILSLLIVGSLPLIIGLLLAYIRGTDELRNTIGHNFEGLAGEVAHKTDLIIAKELGELRHYTSSSDLIRAIEVSNKVYNGLSPSEIEKRLKEGEATWNTEKNPGVKSKGILENLGSRYLVKSTTDENKEKINIALFATDKRGAVVTSINGYPKYLNSGEEWWNKAYNDGKGKVYLGNEYFDEVVKAHVWEIAIPVTNEENGQVIGILKAVLNINEFFQPSIFHIRFGKTGHAMLVDSEGKVIICPVLPTGAHIADKHLISLVTSPNQGWIKAENDAHGGRNSIVGFAPIEDANQILKGSIDKSWHSFIRQDPKELYSPLYAMLRDVIIYGVLLIGVIITAGLIMSERLVQPIKALQEGAEIIGRGNLDHRLTITSNDEIGVLGDKFNEMTEKLKRSYLEIEDSLEKLKEMDKFKSEFISLVSHELRTPLTSIIGFSELLIDRVPGEINMVQEEYIKNVQSSGQQLLEIINNLLDISKLQAGKLELVLSDFDIGGLISEVEGSVMPLINRKELSFENRIEDGIPMIYADRAKIKQTLLNLISNAIKFTPKGGFVRVDVTGTVVHERPMLQISVADTGVGIAAEDRAKIFEEFRQVNSTYAREYPGTGLGLSIAKRFVEMHGGFIWVESRPGEGSTFSFRIPVKTEKSTASKVDSRQVKEIGTRAKEERAIAPGIDAPQILVVEDDLKTSKLMGLYLTQSGYRVIYAYDGVEAVEKAKEHRPFAITLDIMIPNKDGWQVLRELKGLTETKDIPVIIVSIINDKEMGFFLGAADYLTKPIDKKKLLESLKNKGFTTKVKKKPVSILAIDDDLQILMLLESILGVEGFGVVKASSGEEGYNVAVEVQPDLIILDLLMPDINGFEILRRLKRHPTTKGIPVIILTAKELTSDDKRLLSGNIMEVLNKGGSLREDLVSEVKRFEKLYPDKGGMIDGLTGLYNERYLRSRLDEEIARYGRFKRPFSLIIMNIDEFRHYNEVNGTEEGDKVLRELADIIKKNTRAQNPICRRGGSSFAIVLTETYIDTTFQVAEKLKGLIECHHFPHREKQPAGRLTIAAGVASFNDDIGTSDRLIVKAQKAADDARTGSGNRVIKAV